MQSIFSRISSERRARFGYAIRNSSVTWGSAVSERLACADIATGNPRSALPLVPHVWRLPSARSLPSIPEDESIEIDTDL